jgi:hypothetical protein
VAETRRNVELLAAIAVAWYGARERLVMVSERRPGSGLEARARTAAVESDVELFKAVAAYLGKEAPRG